MLTLPAGVLEELKAEVNPKLPPVLTAPLTTPLTRRVFAQEGTGTSPLNFASDRK